MTAQTVTDLLADIEPVVRGWIAEQIGDNANSNIPGDQFEFEFSSLADGNTLYYDGTSYEWRNTTVLGTFPGLGASGRVRIGDTISPPVTALHIRDTVNTTIGVSGEGKLFTFDNLGTGDNYFMNSVKDDAAGDPGILLLVQGSTGWLVGLDNSDSDALKFSSTWNDLAGGAQVIFTTTGEVAIAGAIDASFKLAIHGQQVIDHTSTEALLVRKNADGGDVFTVDTTNARASVGVIAGASHRDFNVFNTTDAILKLSGAITGADNAFAELQFNNRTTPVSSWISAYRDGADNSSNLTFWVTNAGALAEAGRISAAGYLGWGTTTPSAPVDVEGANTPEIRITENTGQVNDYGALTLLAWTDGTAWAQMRGMFSGGTTADILFLTTTNAGAAITEKMRLTSAGRLGILAPSPSGQVHIDQTSATGAIPALYLDQGDVSEQLILGSYSGADVDMIIIELDVDGAPKFGWSETPDVFSLNKGIAIGDGGTTNYANFAGDGELTLFGTARVVRQIPIANANLGKGGTAPTQVIIGDYNSWEYDINDDTVFTFHLPHDWATGTAVTISIDWVIDQAFATNSGEVKWQIVWAATPHDESEPLDGPTHTGTADTGDIYIPATALTMREDGLTIAGASLSAEDQIGVTLSRIALTGGNNPSGNVDPAVVDIHIQYTADKLGEAT